MKHVHLIPAVLGVLVLAGCDLPGLRPAPSVTTAVAPPPVANVLTPQGAKTAAGFDQSTAAEKQAALQTPAGGAPLGRVAVSLGNPSEQGFWLKSALVSAKRAGVVKLDSGKTVQVDLLPAAGGGAQLSLAAYRALGLGLTDLPNVAVLTR